MKATELTVRPVRPDELDRVEALLDAAGLPSSDVRAKPECFVLASVDSAVVGVGGIERHGSVGLLRSIAIRDVHRSEGYGTALCRGLERTAGAAGLETLYLLTTTAAPFFRRLGYDEVDREAVPPSIQESTQFTDLCPSSAICMQRSLSPDS